MRTWAWTAMGLLLLAPQLLSGADREVSGVLGTMANPLSLQLRLKMGWTQPLTESTHPLRAGAHLAAGLEESLTPAYSRTGAWVRLAPLSVFNVTAGAEVAGFFGTFRHVTSLPSYDADFSDEGRESADAPAQAAFGHRLYLAPVLQAALGRVAVRSSWSIEHWKVNVRGPYYYEPFRGTLLDRKGDGVLAGSSVLLVDITRSRDRAFQIGVMHEMLDVPNAPHNRMQRLGPLLIKRLPTGRLGLRNPTVYCGALYYLESPNRAGVAAVLALGFDGFESPGARARRVGAAGSRYTLRRN